MEKASDILKKQVGINKDRIDRCKRSKEVGVQEYIEERIEEIKEHEEAIDILEEANK